MRQRLKFEWERLDEKTCRSKVIGGWILRSINPKSESMVFIPDNEHGWIILKEVKSDISGEI